MQEKHKTVRKAEKFGENTGRIRKNFLNMKTKNKQT